METETGWGRAAGESTGRWRTILSKASGRATVPAPPEPQARYDQIPPQAWTEFSRQNAEWRARRRDWLTWASSRGGRIKGKA